MTFRTFSRPTDQGGDILINVDHIICIERSTSHSCRVLLRDNSSFETDITFYHIRAELDEKFIFEK